MKSKLLLILFSIIILTNACKKEDQATIDDNKIKEYISANNIDSVQTSSTGLYYKVIRTGNANYPTISDQIKVNYKGYLLDGTVFDSANNTSFALNRVITGWQEGLQYVSEGGKIFLIVPSALGYGNQSVGSIPANSVLVFEVDLITIL